MRARLLGALTGIALGLGLIVVAPATANAAAWSFYANSNKSSGTQPSSSNGKILRNKIRIAPPGGLTELWNQNATVVVAVTKGKILANTTTGPGVLQEQVVTSPQTNTVARCKLVALPGAVSGTSLHECSSYR